MSKISRHGYNNNNNNNNFTLKQVMKAQRRAHVQLYSSLNLGGRLGGGCSTPRLGHFTSGKDPVPIV